MRSSCPHCLSLTEHAHEEAQVTCSSCGQSFSPFLTDSDSGSASDAALTPDFSESSLAFQDIVTFGEALGTEKSPTEPASSSAAPAAPSAVVSESVTGEPLSEASLNRTPHSSGVFLTTTSTPPHQAPHITLPPVSLMVLMGEDHAPLENGFKSLTDLATRIQADGIIGIRCSLSPDNRRALLIGTPIRWEKK